MAGEALITLSLAKGSQPFTLLGAKAGAHLVVGPEGDFSPAEENLLQAQGFEPVTLGPLTLRCETAAIAAVASINAVWGFSEHTQKKS